MWRDVRTHLPRVTARHPQAAALSVKSGNKAGGTEGREPSLHMDASASILRPLSPYGPVQRGLPSYPRFPALRCCGSSVRRGILCCGIGGQGARQPFGRTTAASESGAGSLAPPYSLPSVPCASQKGWKMPARRSCVIPPMAASHCFGGQVNCPRRRRTPPRP